MKAENLKSGQFFEFDPFDQRGYGFGRCLFVGIDDDYICFVYRRTGHDRFLCLNLTYDGQNVITEGVPQSWE